MAVVFGGGLLLGAGAAGAQAAACHVGQVHPRAEANLIRSINVARRADGLRPVRVSARLRAVARRTSVRMVRQGMLQHDRLLWGKGWAVAQNVARARTPFVAFNRLEGSGPHRENTHDPQWRTAGVGAARTCRGALYFTVNFSRAPRRPRPPGRPDDRAELVAAGAGR